MSGNLTCKLKAMLQTIAVNSQRRVRLEIWNGRRYWVAPITMMRPQVLNGSKGPLYYPPEEIEKNYTDWNHVPIVLDHPEEDGEPCSARKPDILEEVGLGYIFNSEIDNADLEAEAWFDEERTRKTAPRILSRLKSGKKIEMSTGLYTDNEPITGNINGEHYDFIARNYRPDHLAILLDRPGACSIEDGCGVLANGRNSKFGMFRADVENELKLSGTTITKGSGIAAQPSMFARETPQRRKLLSGSEA